MRDDRPMNPDGADVGRVASPTRTRRRRLHALVAVSCLGVVSLTGVLPSGAEPGDPVGAGDIVPMNFFPEPGFTLVAGSESWSVYDRPTGTVTTAFGHPADALHDEYMASARHNPLEGSYRGSKPDMLASLAPNPSAGREGTWNVVRDERSLLFRGPLDSDSPRQQSLGRHVGWNLVGGTVLSDTVDPDGSGTRTLDEVLLVDSDGRLDRFDFEPEFRISELGSVTEEFGPDVKVLAAVPRTYSDSAQVLEHGSLLPNHPDVEILMVLLDNGELVPVTISGSEIEIQPSLSALAGEDLAIDPAILADDPLLDFDYTCIRTPTGKVTAGSETGEVATFLGCAPGRSGTALAWMSGGRLSAGVATKGSTGAGHGVSVVTFADSAITTATDGGVARSDHRVEEACRITRGPVAPGSFDVRTIDVVTHVACAEGASAIPSGVISIDTYRQPMNGSFRGEGDERRAIRGTQSSYAIRRIADRNHDPVPGAPDVGSRVTEELYENVTGLTVALQFPCHALVGRPTNSAGTFGANCAFGTGDGVPRNVVSITAAGYGEVDGERRVFMYTHPHEELLKRSVNWRGEVWRPDVHVREHAWVIEPSPYSAGDLQRLRENAADSRTFDYFEPSDLDPLLLTDIPSTGMIEMKYRILSDTPLRETVPVAPIAVLQAPPTVRGLGQQTTFTPEFGDTSFSETAATSSISSRVGNHTGVEATLVVGGGMLGNNVRLGGGLAASLSFMAETEQSVEDAVTIEQTENYGGSFTDHTVVTRSIVQDTWRAVITEDPTGLGVGDQFDYSIPRSVVDQSVPLSVLETEQPRLYAAGGLLRPSLDRILVGEIGDVGSYLGDADLEQPQSVLAENGGPCRGGYADQNSPTPSVDSRPRGSVDNNPFFASTGNGTPTGPSVLVSRKHVVSVGNDLTEGAEIVYSESTAESLVTSESYDRSATAMLKFTSESDGGFSHASDVTLSFGIDGGYSNAAAVTSTLGTGSGLSVVMGNIPHAAEGDQEWLANEQYGWRMYMCKARLGPGGMGLDVWVQGYVTDGYEHGSGGLDDFGDVMSTAPVDSAVVLADPLAVPAAPLPCPDLDVAGLNEFRWNHPTGAVERYGLQVENVSSGGLVDHELDTFESPTAFETAGRVDCAELAAGNFTDDDLYRWRPEVRGFLGERRLGDWHFFRPQVWPPSQTLEVTDPSVNADGSATMWITAPEGVESLRYDVTVRRADDPSPAGIVAEPNGVGSRYLTPTLPPGDYVVDVVGYNSHVLDDPDPEDGLSPPRAETPKSRVSFTVGESAPSGGFACLGSTFTVTGLTDAGFNVVLGTSGPDDLQGTSGRDAIFGLEGDDVLSGFDGNDLLCGGDGDDEILAGAGHDETDGGEGADRILGEDGNDLLVGGSGDDNLYAGPGNDEVFGDAGNDVIEAGDGNDDVFGGDHDDTIDAGPGADEVYGEAGDDTISGGDDTDYDLLSGGPGEDTVIESSSRASPPTPGPPTSRPNDR